MSNIQHGNFDDLIENRRKEFGLSVSELVRKLGHQNLNKGCQRYRHFVTGNIEQPFILENLHHALSLDPEVISAVLGRTRQKSIKAEHFHHEQIDIEWRSAFKIHGIIETERTIPQPRFAAALSGSVNHKFVKLDTSKDAPSYLYQMIDKIPSRVCDNGTIIAFGKPIGFIINFAPDHAIRYDLAGNPREELSGAVRLGGGYMRVR